jgi:hypothetical protein
MKIFSLVLLFALAACAELQLAVDSSGAADGIVAEALNAARAPAAEQKAALSLAQQAFAESSSTLNRLRLAALLATLPGPLRDDARAAELLEPLTDSGAPGARRFAAFLSTQIAERQRLAREIERLGRERATAERERANADKDRDKREEALRQQLEALRAIERGILEREERLRKKGGKP